MTSCSDACSLITDHGQEPSHCKRNDGFFSQSTRADMPASQLGHLQCAQLGPAPGSVFWSDWEPSPKLGAVIHHHLSLSFSFTIDRHIPRAGTGGPSIDVGHNLCTLIMIILPKTREQASEYIHILFISIALANNRPRAISQLT